MKFTKKDLIFSIVTGLIAGTILWQVLNFLEVKPVFGVPFGLLVIAVPVIWIIGVNLGYFLGKWFEFFNQFGKYAAVGFTNFAVDLGVLNLLISLTGDASGLKYTLFKTLSFIVAVTNSYTWNRLWVFNASSSQDRGSEFAKFMGVNILAALVNVGVASFIVNFVPPVLGLDAKVWATVGAIVGSAIALSFTFIGLKLAVFKK